MKVNVVRDDLESREEEQVEFDGSTVEELLKSEGIPVQEVLVSKSGTIVSDRHELEDGDRVKVFDVIAGG
ncbi:MAG: MoaD/ThiS family protein [Candidatus Nanohaloarchaea archaeon]